MARFVYAGLRPRSSDPVLVTDDLFMLATAPLRECLTEDLKDASLTIVLLGFDELAGGKYRTTTVDIAQPLRVVPFTASRARAKAAPRPDDCDFLVPFPVGARARVVDPMEVGSVSGDPFDIEAALADLLCDDIDMANAYYEAGQHDAAVEEEMVDAGDEGNSSGSEASTQGGDGAQEALDIALDAPAALNEFDQMCIDNGFEFRLGSYFDIAAGLELGKVQGPFFGGAMKGICKVHKACNVVLNSRLEGTTPVSATRDLLLWMRGGFGTSDDAHWGRGQELKEAHGMKVRGRIA